MNEPFMPLLPGAAGPNRPDFRVAIVSRAENLRPFQPAGHNGGEAETGDRCEPRVALKRDGERISAIHVECSCGQVIELACVYEKAKG